MDGIGRPSFVENQRKVNNFLEYIKSGCTIGGACKGVGISRKTWERTQKMALEFREKDEENAYTNFYDAYEAAMNEFEIRNLTNIQAHARTDWKASAWLLERRLKSDYALVQQVELATPDKITINMGSVKKETPKDAAVNK